MPKEEYTKEQLWKLFEKLPEELQEAIFSEETANSIWDICTRNKIEKVSEVANYVGQVLLGILLPDDFQKTLEKELKLDQEKAKKVAQEINRFIFYPVKPVLDKLYKMEVVETPKPVKPTEAAPPTEGKPPTPPSKDVYREFIE